MSGAIRLTASSRASGWIIRIALELTAGENTIRIVSEGSNPGNYNLDSITFNYVDTSVNAFSQIEAESASYLEGDIVVAEDSSASDGNVLSATGQRRLGTV